MHFPNFVVNWLVVNVAYIILPMLYKQSKHYLPTGNLHHHVTNNPRLYNELRRRLDALSAHTSNKGEDIHVKTRANKRDQRNKGSRKELTKDAQNIKLQSSSTTPLSTLVSMVFIIYLSISAWFSIGLAILCITNGVHPTQSGMVTGVAFGVSIVLWKQLCLRSGELAYISALSAAFSVVTGLCALYPQVPEFILGLETTQIISAILS